MSVSGIKIPYRGHDLHIEDARFACQVLLSRYHAAYRCCLRVWGNSIFVLMGYVDRTMGISSVLAGLMGVRLTPESKENKPHRYGVTFNGDSGSNLVRFSLENRAFRPANFQGVGVR